MEADPRERREALAHLKVAHLAWYPQERVAMAETKHPEACWHHDPTTQSLKMMELITQMRKLNSRGK